MTAEKEIEERFVNIEMIIANQERVIDDLNQVIIEQGKMIAALQKQNLYFLTQLDQDAIKPLSEETPPPHY